MKIKYLIISTNNSLIKTLKNVSLKNHEGKGIGKRLRQEQEKINFVHLRQKQTAM